MRFGKYLIFICLVLISTSAQAQVTVNAVSSAFDNTNGATTPKTNTGLTIAAGSNIALICAFVSNLQVPGFSANWDSTGTPQALAQLAVSNIPIQTTGRLELWGVKAPHTGNKTLSVAWTGGTNDVGIYCVAFNGVDQTTPFPHAGPNTNDGDGTQPPIVSIVTAANNATFGVALSNTQSITNIDSPHTLLFTSGAPNCCFIAGARNAPAASPDVYTFTVGNTSRWAAIAADIAAATGGAAIVCKRSILGVGC